MFKKESPRGKQRQQNIEARTKQRTNQHDPWNTNQFCSFLPPRIPPIIHGDQELLENVVLPYDIF